LEKGIAIQNIKAAFQSAHKYDIDCCAYIMIGVPSETEEDIRLTMRLIKDIKPNHLHCSICTPMPRTYLYGKLMGDGIITHDYWLDFAINPDPSFKTPFASQLYSAEELRRMQNTIQKQFYLNPRIILHEILKTRGLKQFNAKAQMALKMLFH
jgi:radical SAM superfamily enzyme YgiQ (UPF0313 family)